MPLPGPPDEARNKDSAVQLSTSSAFPSVSPEQRELVYNALANNEGWTATVDQEREL
jgi:hypothetical protein